MVDYIVAGIADYYVFLFAVWVFFSVYLIREVSIKGSKSVNPYFYDNIPNIFVTIGVLGTFSGIFVGLQDFDTNNINGSIPKLLEGLKTAFLSSIIGIILSIIFKKISQGFLHKVEKNRVNLPQETLRWMS